MTAQFARLTMNSMLHLQGQRPGLSGPSGKITPISPENGAESVSSNAPSALRFPGEDGGKSLSEIAQRDLDAALQLLVDRAQYITGASGAAIALREEGEMICRARAGTSAPDLGAKLQMDFGLTGESVRTQQILRCDDAETDDRVNRESCRALGIASVVVVPLKREQEVVGVFELLSGKAYAFDERDIVAVQRLAEMIQTALDQAEAVKRAEQELIQSRQPRETGFAGFSDSSNPPTSTKESAGSTAISTVVHTPGQQARREPHGRAMAAAPQISISVRTCQACGFPVSEGRKLCLDCETKGLPTGENNVIQPSAESPAFLVNYGAEAESAGWLRSNIYWIGIGIVSLVSAAVVLWLR
jgi:putative methionine-R-sulfoxide reductase with GAF domain